MTALWLDQTYWGFDVSGTNNIYNFSRPQKRALLLPRASVTLDSNDLLSLRARHLFYRNEEDLVYRSPFSASGTSTTQEANGGELEWSHVQASGLRSLAGVFFNRQDIRGSNLGTPDGNAVRNSWSQLGSVEYPFWQRLKIQGGYRFDHDSAFGNKLSPQAAIAMRVRRGASLSASATRGFRAPDFSELYLNNTHAGGRVRVLGNTTLRPEQSWSYTAGALFTPGNRLRVDARLFENRLDDMILSRLTGREGIASIYRYVNVGSAKIRGGLVSSNRPSAGAWKCTRRISICSPGTSRRRAARILTAPSRQRRGHLLQPFVRPAGRCIRQSDRPHLFQRDQRRAGLHAQF